MTRQIIEAPETITAQQILSERNVEVRRIMVERIGHERFLCEAGARPIHHDDTGALYRIAVDDDEPILLVHVTNATPEPDGSRRRFVLRVPPTMERARQAIAWTFDMEEEEYQPTVQT